MPCDWGYTKENGPNTWASKYPSAAGPNQSPIDIPSNLKRFKPQKALIWAYKSRIHQDLTNTGYAWKVHINGKDSLLTGGPIDDNYVIEQFHCHWGEKDNQGSEHTVNGHTYAGELHLVHWNTKYRSFEEAAKHPDGLCILGVFLKAGEENKELNKIINQLNEIEHRGERTIIESCINPGLLIPKQSGYYTYNGSLTTPPCSECVIWIVFKEPLQVSHNQLVAFRNLKSYCKHEGCPQDNFNGCVKTNFRPTLPLGDREIHEML